MISAFAGLIAYGVWAYMVNVMHGIPAAVKAACVQGGYSFTLTFIMTMLIELLYRVASRISRSEIVTNTMTIVSTCGVIFSTSWWVNVMAGTPEIFDTVILGYVVGGVYTAYYVLSLSKAQMRQLVE